MGHQTRGPRDLMACAMVVAMLGGGIAEATAQELSGYVTGRFGLGAMDDLDLELSNPGTNPTTQSFNIGSDLNVQFDAALGLKYGFARAELQGDLSVSGLDSFLTVTTLGAGGGTSDLTRESFLTAGGFGNAYLDIPLTDTIEPFIGGGVGYVGTNHTRGDFATTLAYQGMGGVTFGLQDNGALEIGYRYRRLNSFDADGASNTTIRYPDLDSHTVFAGFRYRFGGGGSDRSDSAARAQPAPGQSAPAPRPTAQAQGAEPLPFIAPTNPGPPPRSANVDGFAPPSQAPAPLGALPPSPRPSPGPIATAPSTPGAFGVQLAAYRDPRNADRGWTVLRGEHPDLLAALKPQVVVARIPGKGTYHRLYAAGLTETDADRLCQSLKARRAWCTVARL